MQRCEGESCELKMYVVRRGRGQIWQVSTAELVSEATGTEPYSGHNWPSREGVTKCQVHSGAAKDAAKSIQYSVSTTRERHLQARAAHQDNF